MSGVEDEEKVSLSKKEEDDDNINEEKEIKLMQGKGNDDDKTEKDGKENLKVEEDSMQNDDEGNKDEKDDGVEEKSILKKEEDNDDSSPPKQQEQQEQQEERSWDHTNRKIMVYGVLKHIRAREVEKDVKSWTNRANQLLQEDKNKVCVARFKKPPGATWVLITLESESMVDAFLQAFKNDQILNKKGKPLRASRSQLRNNNTVNDKEDHSNENGHGGQNKRGRDDNETTTTANNNNNEDEGSSSRSKRRKQNETNNKNNNNNSRHHPKTSDEIRDVLTPLWRLSYEQQLKRKWDEMVKKCAMRIVQEIKKRFRTLEYEARHNKNRKVVKLYPWIAKKRPIEVNPLLPSPRCFEYRNKCELTFGYRFVPNDSNQPKNDDVAMKEEKNHHKEEEDVAMKEENQNEETNTNTTTNNTSIQTYQRVPAIGFLASGWAGGVSKPHCLQNIPNEVCSITDIINTFLQTSPIPPYNSKEHRGIWRLVTIRSSIRTGQCMIVIQHAPPAGGVGAKMDGTDDYTGIFEKEKQRLISMLTKDNDNDGILMTPIRDYPNPPTDDKSNKSSKAMKKEEDGKSSAANDQSKPNDKKEEEEPANHKDGEDEIMISTEEEKTNNDHSTNEKKSSSEHEEEKKKEEEDDEEMTTEALPPKQIKVTSIFFQEFEGLSTPRPEHPVQHVYGKTFIEETLGQCTFRISPGAFFQVTTDGAEILYNVVVQKVKEVTTTTTTTTNHHPEKAILFDICCGTGTIGLTCLKEGVVGRVVGVDISEPAIEDAIANAKLNGWSNETENDKEKEDEKKDEKEGEKKDEKEEEKEEGGKKEEKEEGKKNDGDNASKKIPSSFVTRFVASRAESVLAVEMKNISDNNNKNNNDNNNNEPVVVAVVDPAREGLHPDVIRTIRTNSKIERLVYVSCNPTGSLVKDASMLCAPPTKKYGGLPFKITSAQPVDMFPLTNHCEMVMTFDRMMEKEC